MAVETSAHLSLAEALAQQLVADVVRCTATGETDADRGPLQDRGGAQH